MDEAAQAKPTGPCVHYQRRRPEQTTLYQLVQEHVEYRFFVCNFSEFFEEDSNNLFVFIRLAGYGVFGCGRRPR